MRSECEGCGMRVGDDCECESGEGGVRGECERGEW